MRIAIAARGLSFHSGGTREYTKNLIIALTAIDLNNEYFIYYSHQDQVLNLDRPNVNEVVLPQLPNLIWDQVLLPIRMKADCIDIGIFTKGTVPLLTSSKTIVSILDLGYFYPGLNAYKFFDTAYIKRMMPLSARRASAVLAISNNTRVDIHRFFPGMPDDKIQVVHLASTLPVKRDLQADIRMKYHLGDKPYIYFAASVSPRKNLERMIKAIHLIKDKVPHQFVVTGGKTRQNQFLDGLLQQFSLQERFKRLGYVDTEDMPALYHQAEFYVMPSLYEGFSLTVVEAMEAGCPVAASNMSSHPEVAGEAAVLFDPYRVDDIASAMLRLASDERLRNDLRKIGLLQAGKFSWARCAQETLAVIKDVSRQEPN